MHQWETLIACLLIVGFAVLFSINVDSIVEYMGQQNEIVIFMSLDTPDDYMAVMESDLDAMDGLGEITYVSRDQAFEDYKEKLGDKADILDGMEGRPLSAGKFPGENRCAGGLGCFADVDPADGLCG